MPNRTVIATVTGVALLTALAAACGGRSEDTSYAGLEGAGGLPGNPGQPTSSNAWSTLTTEDMARAGVVIPPGGYGMTQQQYDALQQEAYYRLKGLTAEEAAELIKQTSGGRVLATAAPALAIPGQPGPAGPAGPSLAVATATPAPRPGGSTAPDSSSPIDREVALQAQQARIIVRNVSMSLEVANVQGTVETVSRLASASGGWVVSSGLPTLYQGHIVIRVPADRLDDVLRQVRAMASKVQTEDISSQDFTEEFSDQTARLKTLKDTQETLRALFAKADKVEDAIRVQQEITSIQSEIERIQGRLSFISQSAAYSLVSINLRSVPLPIVVRSGQDKTASTTAVVQFRAEFDAPDGIDSFTAEWDFGDGFGPVIVTRTALKEEGGRTRVTAPVTHLYPDEKDSPFIVTVKLTGTGDAGIAEGKDTLVVNVTTIPPITVFAGQSMTVEAGEEVKFNGTFTRPEALTGLKFTWDFGDGSAPLKGDIGPDVTSAVATHVYPNHRPAPYIATLKVEGTTPAGVAEAQSAVVVQVLEKEGWTAGGVPPVDSGRSAVRTLSAIGNGLLTGAIWAGILSPVWIIAGSLGFVLFRRSRVAARRM